MGPFFTVLDGNRVGSSRKVLGSFDATVRRKHAIIYCSIHITIPTLLISYFVVAIPSPDPNCIQAVWLSTSRNSAIPWLY
jgi:hypothetical protein